VASNRTGAASPAWAPALVLFLAAVAGCRSAAAPADPVEIRLHAPPGAAASIEVVNVPVDLTRRLAASELSREQWNEVLRVSVGEGQPAMLGTYSVTDHTIRFAPMFPLDPGRQYVAVFTPTVVPGAAANVGAPLSAPLRATVALPAIATDPSTIVAQVFPSADVVPENQLRLYIHFSAPMGRRGGLDYIRLLDERGQAVVDPFLPLDAEFWNDDFTRYTVFFDPGRQKRGILPNAQMGRSLVPGRRYTLVVDSEWRDANGLPLKTEYRREFRVAEADERPIDFKAWDVAVPTAGERDPLIVTFPEPLDRGLLLRALGVTAGDQRFLEGDVKIESHETRWRFTPREPWKAGRHQLVALAMLEDMAGNRIGRAFEVDRFDRADPSGEPERTVIPFELSSRRQ
jgi:hypothetical protein